MNGMKNAIMQAFWMAPCLICYFIVKLFYIDLFWEKVTSYEKFSQNLAFQVVWKISAF